MPDRPIDLPPSGAPDFDAGELLFVGTATVLLRYAGFTILTDPNFHRGDVAKLGYGLRSRRLTEPALDIADLPPLDFIVLSHHHGDHVDDVATRELPRDVPISPPATPPGTCAPTASPGRSPSARGSRRWSRGATPG